MEKPKHVGSTTSDAVGIEDYGPAKEPDQTPLPPKFVGAVSGTLVGFSSSGVALVDFPANPALAYLPARSCLRLEQADIGKEVVLLFDGGDLDKPLLIGVTQPLVVPGPETLLEVGCGSELKEIEVGGTTVDLTARESLTIRCGSASITLTADGKILIRGTYLQSRSSGVNRIQGGAVQIN
jgi:hypothetical protein